jgi:phasin family protein
VNHAIPKQQAADSSRQEKVDTALRIATIIAQANERLFRLQSEAINAALTENSKHLMALSSTVEPASVLAEWTALYQSNVRRILDVARTSFEIVPQTQAEMAKLVGEPFASYNKQTQQYLDQFAKAVTDGRDAAAAQMKDFLGKTMQGVSAQPAAKPERVR